jgi:nicotinamide-nucleotide amidase
MLPTTENNIEGMKLFDDEVLKSIRASLLNKGRTIAIAESVTSGLLQFAMSNTMDTIQFFQGGITAYTPNQKFRQLNVEPMHALSVNCVSEQVAAELAENIRIKFQSDYGVGITGYASAVPESDNQLFAYYAIAHGTRILKVARIEAEPEEGIGVSLYYTKEVLRSLAQVLEEES